MMRKTKGQISVCLTESYVEIKLQFANSTENATFFEKMAEAIRDKTVFLKAGNYKFEVSSE